MAETIYAAAAASATEEDVGGISANLAADAPEKRESRVRGIVAAGTIGDAAANRIDPREPQKEIASASIKDARLENRPTKIAANA